MDPTQQTVTRALLARMAAGDERAASELLPLLYGELRGLAHAAMSAGEAHTLQPTALVHEAWIRLQGAGANQAFVDRAHFLSVAAKAMRSVLVDHARRRAALRRGGERERLPLEDVVELFERAAPDLIGLDAALEKLAAVDEQLARIVELRFFGGSSVEDTARALGVSEPTIVRGWRVARMWLRRELESACTRACRVRRSQSPESDARGGRCPPPAREAGPGDAPRPEGGSGLKRAHGPRRSTRRTGSRTETCVCSR